MKDTVIIKVYRNDIACGDYHDLCLKDFDLKVKELKTFADSINKNIYFTVCNALGCADFDCFAEITYNGTLTENEKEMYASIVKFFAKDAKIEKKTLSNYDLPLSIIFTKAEIDTF